MCVRTEYVLASIPFNFICSITTTFRFLTFWPHPRGRGYVYACACVVLYVPFPLIWNATWLFSVKKFFWTFWPHPRGSVCVCKDRICACMVLYAPFPLIEYATLLLSGKKNDLTLSRGWRVCVMTENVLACCCMRDSLQDDMHHDHVLKKLNFDLLTPQDRGMGSTGKIFAACAIPLNLICSMTIFWGR